MKHIKQRLLSLSLELKLGLSVLIFYAALVVMTW